MALLRTPPATAGMWPDNKCRATYLPFVLSLLADLKIDELLALLRKSSMPADASEISRELQSTFRDAFSSTALKAISIYVLSELRKQLDEGTRNSTMTSESPPQAVTAAAGRRVVDLIEVEVLEAQNHACNGRFVQISYENILERGCTPRELALWQMDLEQGAISWLELVFQLVRMSLKESEADRSNHAQHDPHVLHVMGTGERVTLADWQARAGNLKKEGPQSPAATEEHARFPLTTPPRLAVTAIASLYRGGRHIRRFMENITGQTCFRDYAELIIIDANSPDRERDVIEPYLARYTNIRYIRVNHRIGIYDAWNRAIKEARGEYLTCTNVDDLRREDSLELQAATLDALPFVDVVYQDFLYSFDAELAIDQVARHGVRSQLPLITRYSILNFNPPHNAPMWRRRLHDQLGLFDTRYESAGDYDFWMRCVAAGKTFYKLNDPHVAYYQNPEGISTRTGTRGFAETKAVHRSRDRELISELLVMPFAEFGSENFPYLASHPDDGTQDRARRCQLALRECAREVKYGARPARAAA
jgi:glycosyltransferase involved in cell wall biosynthesis